MINKQKTLNNKNFLGSFICNRKFLLPLFIFLVSSFQSSIFVSTNRIELTDQQLATVVSSINEKLQNTIGIQSKVIIGVLKNVLSSGITESAKWIINQIKDAQSVKSNRMEYKDMERSPIGLVMVPSVANKVQEIKLKTMKAISQGNTVHNFLFSGPAGTGKTTVAFEICDYFRMSLKKNPVRGVHGVIVYLIRGAEWAQYGPDKAIEKLQKNIKEWDSLAKYNLVVIIFDEIEAVCPDRSNSSQEKIDFLNTMLSWTGQHKHRIIIIGTTNIRDRLDAAMRRRFGECLEIAEPDLPARIEILLKYVEYYVAQNKDYVCNIIDPVIQKEFLFIIGDRSEKFSGADFDNAVKKAVEEAVSTTGFIYPYLIVKHVNEEKYKKATFSKSNDDIKAAEVRRLLGADEFYGWIRSLNSYKQLVSIGINYGEQISDICLTGTQTIMDDLISALVEFYAMIPILGPTVSFSSFVQLAIVNLSNNIIYGELGGVGILADVDHNFAEQQAQSLFAINLQDEVAVKSSKLSYIKKNDKMVEA
jgi:DNA polymerase III delta prime subunit